MKPVPARLYDYPFSGNGYKVRLALAHLATREEQQEERRRILRQLFGRGGDSVWMQPPFYCDYGTNIEPGEHVFFNFSVVTKDIPEGVFPAGNPCRVIRDVS